MNRIKNKVWKKKIILPLLILLLTTSKGVVMGESPNYKVEIKEKYKQLNLSDGVTKEEAIIIAQNYMIEERLDKSYAILKPAVEDFEFSQWNEWRVIFKARYIESIKQANIFGLIGIFKWWISVNVHKKTGEIKSVGGPDL